MRILIVLIALFMNVACAAHHVKLAPPPSTDASVERRLKYYETHRPVGEHRQVRGAPGSETVVSSTLRLANGSEISEPEDLLVAVASSSRTALAARRMAAARVEKQPWEIGGGILLAAGAVATTGSLFVPGNALVVAGVGVVLLGAGVVPMFIAGGIGREIERARDEAFTHYDDGLQQQLALEVTTSVSDAHAPPKGLK